MAVRGPFAQEIKPNMIELMKQKATFLQSEIQDGDIVCFQTEMSEQSVVFGYDFPRDGWDC
jgi:hypothetical protein